MRKALVLGSLFLVAIAGCGPGRERLEALVAPSPQDAESTFRRACAPCHGLGGLGDGPVASALARRPPDLTALAARHGGIFPRALVIATITGENPVMAHGTREMPVWSLRFDQERTTGATAAAALWARRRTELLADYIGSLQRPEPDPPAP